jgi:predicted Zn-dependent protease
MATDTKNTSTVKPAAPRIEPRFDKRSRLQKGRRVNLPLLFASVVVLGCLSVASYFWNQSQEAKLYGALKQRASVSADQKDWGRASAYWQRYLSIAPDDFDARMSLIDAVEKRVTAPRERRRLSLLLHEAIGRAPNNDVKVSLLVRVAENLLEMGDYSGAYVAALTLLDPKSGKADVSGDSDNAAKLRRICALTSSVLAKNERNVESAGMSGTQARDRAEVSIPMAANYLAASSADFPEDIRLAVVAANFYRLYENSVNVPEPVARADEFMNQLVLTRPNDADAFVARYTYRKSYNIADSDADLTRALELDPTHYEGLLLSAGGAAQKDLNVARTLLKKAITAKPNDNRGYLATAQLEASKQNWDAAVMALTEGQRAVGPHDIAIANALTHALIRANKLTDADAALKRFDAAYRAQLSDISVSNRRVIQDQLQLLRAQLAIAGGNLRGAVVPLMAIVVSSEQETAAEATGTAREAKELLAKVMEQLGYWDLAATYWSDLSTVPPETDDARSRGVTDARRRAAGEASRRASIALLNAGQIDRAIQTINGYLHPPVGQSGLPAWTPAPDACLVLTQAHLQKQLAVSSDARNWTEFLSALEMAKRLTPPRVEACLAEFDYQRSRDGEESSQAANAALAMGEKEFADNVKFWKAATLGYQSLGQKPDAERALARFDALEANVAQRAALHAVYAVREGDYDAADKLLSQAVGEATDEERIGLQLLRINVLTGAGAAESALQLAAEEIERVKNADDVKASPQELKLLAVGIEAALQRRDYKLAEEWEALLASADRLDDFSVRYFRARRLLDQYELLSADDRTIADQLVAELRTARPNSGDTVVLAGKLADLKKNWQQAIDSYQLAIALGNKNPATMERLVAVLFAEGRYDLAEAYLSRLSVGAQSSATMESLAIATALRRNQVAEAIALARKAVVGHPDDPVRQIWLANLLAQDAVARAEKPVEAEEALRSSIRQFPADARVWNAMFMLLLRTAQNDQARLLLEEFASTLGDDSWDRHFVAAQVNQQLGEHQRAVQEAEAAAKIQPNNVAGRMFLAKLLMSSDVARATAEFEEIRKNLHPSIADDGEARRQLAILYSASGTEEGFRRAEELLKNSAINRAPVEEAADIRLRAALLSRRGRTRQERGKNTTEARKLLEAMVEERGAAADDVDKLLLAKFYEQEAAQLMEQLARSVETRDDILRRRLTLLHAARENYQDLVSRDQTPIGSTIEYTNFLLRQLAQLTNVKNTDDGLSVLLEVFTEDAKSRIAELERESQRDAKSVDILQALSCRVRLQNAMGDNEAAKVAASQFIEKNLPGLEQELGQPRAWLAIATLYSSIGEHVESETWYRRLVSLAPESYVLVARELIAQGRTDEAIKECLEASQASGDVSPQAATALAQLMASASVETDNLRRIEQVIAAALRSHGDNVDLLMAVAVLNVTRQNDAEAIRYFRRVVELAPNNALALNNLATLLAEQADHRDEALALVTRAIDSNGRQPALLDTLGTIYIRGHQFESAITSLEEAVAGGGGDARFYFHLAAAYYRAKMTTKAKEAFAAARELGLAKSILTEGDQDLLEELEQQFGPFTTSPSLESSNSAAPDVSRFSVYSSLMRAG